MVELREGGRGNHDDDDDFLVVIWITASKRSEQAILKSNPVFPLLINDTLYNLVREDNGVYVFRQGRERNQ